MVKIACQTIVYGNPTIKDNIESILKNVSEIGYKGVEIGARHFYMDKQEFYKELLEKLNLELMALHVGGDFLDRNSVETQLANMGTTIEFAQKLGVPYIYLSGTHKKEGKTLDDYVHEAKVIGEVAKRVTDAGLILCYHNHAWEMQNDMEGMNSLLDKIPAETMKLVPDVGWLTIGGVDPVKFLSDNLDRVEALHFKDFKGPRQFTELGTGIVNFKAVYEFFSSKRKDFWITAEQDTSAIGPEISAKQNYEYIKSLIK